MDRRNKLNIVLTYATALYLFVFGLVTITLVCGQHIPSSSHLTIYCCTCLLALVAVAFLSTKIQLTDKESNRKWLNRILIPFSFLGPVLFSLGIYHMFREDYASFFVFACMLEPFSIATAIVFLIINTTSSSKLFSWFGLPLFVLLTLINLYCFIPLGDAIQKIFDIHIYDWAVKALYVILSLSYG